MKECPICHCELDEWDITIGYCPHCDSDIDAEDFEDQEIWENIDRESINGLDDEEYEAEGWEE